MVALLLSKPLSSQRWGREQKKAWEGDPLKAIKFTLELARQPDGLTAGHCHPETKATQEEIAGFLKSLPLKWL